jgi:hypothetical protein
MSSKPNKVTGRHGFINIPAYKAFKAKYPEADVTYREYIDVLKASTCAIRDHILDNPLGFKLPYNFGYIAVDKFKPLNDYVLVDWKNSRRLKRRILFTNLHSFGYIFKIKLYPNPKIVPMRVHKFDAHRLVKRALAKRVKEGKEYLEIDRSYYSRRFRIGEHISWDKEK